MRVLPACAAFVACALWAVVPAAAQDRYRAARQENFRADPAPDGALLASVNAGTELGGGAARGGWVEVTLEGWIWAQSVRPSDRAGWDLRVSASGAENLRAAPNGRVLARVRSGTLLSEIARSNGWVHVRRSAWMWRQSLEPIVAVASAAPAVAPAPADTPSPAAGSPPSLDRAVTSAATSLLRTPDGDTTGRLAARAAVRVLARSGEWVRVQTEGWVRETELRPADDGVLLGVTGAEVRSRPDAFEGQLLQWRLQFISLQRADELRREMPSGAPYLLTRGPLPEAGFVYVILTADQRARLADLAPLSELVVIGRLTTGRSRYVGNPILELVDVTVHQP